MALVYCIQAGLLPDGKQAAIVPFNLKGVKTATLLPMMEGKLHLARRATPGLSLRVRVVYKDDEFEYSEGLKPVLNHTINPNADRRDNNVMAAYAVAVLPGASEPEFEVFYRADIDRYRSFSRSKDGGPWVTHFAEMAKKAVLGQLLKRLPKAVGAPPESVIPAMEADALSLEDLGIVDAQTSASEPIVVNTETGEIRQESEQPDNAQHEAELKAEAQDAAARDDSADDSPF